MLVLFYFKPYFGLFKSSCLVFSCLLFLFFRKENIASSLLLFPYIFKVVIIEVVIDLRQGYFAFSWKFGYSVLILINFFKTCLILAYKRTRQLKIIREIGDLQFFTSFRHIRCYFFAWAVDVWSLRAKITLLFAIFWITFQLKTVIFEIDLPFLFVLRLSHEKPK